MKRLVTLLALVGLLIGAISVTAISAQDESVDKHRAEVSSAVDLVKNGVAIESGADTASLRSSAAVAVPAPANPGKIDSDIRNIKVNQDYSDFPQNETVIAVNPLNRRNLVAGANDYRIGYGQSGFYTSFDGGKSWIDGIIPIPSWPDGDVPDGGGDPVTLFDTLGNVYYFGLAFERANNRSALVVSKSTNGGRTWSRPSFTTGSGVVVANLDPAASVLHDKEWAVIDLTVGKANSHTNRIYVTWTRFNLAPPFDSPIYEAHSDDGGVTWSTPHEINGASVLCDYITPLAVVTRCQDNQPSWPVVGPDGTLYVFFRNVDTVNENQFLMVKSSDGGVTFSDPVKVADIFDINYPRSGTSAGRRTDCAARGQQSGRNVLSNSCFRVNSYGGPAVAPDGTLYLVWSDNRNGNSVQTDVDVFIVKSTDGGATWSAPGRVNSDSIGNKKDQWFPWVAVNADGTVVVVFHDRRSDTTSTVTAHGLPINPPGNYLVDTYLAVSRNKGQSFKNLRVTDVSSNFDFGFRAGLFLGDYNGVAVDNKKTAYPFSTDARNGTDAVRHSDVYLGIVELDK